MTWWFLVFTDLCDTVNPRTFSSLQKQTPAPRRTPPPFHNRSAVSFLYPLATFHLLEASLALCNHQLFSASVDLPILAISYKWNQNVCFSEWHLSFSKMFSGLSMWWYQVSLLHPFYSQTIFHNTDTPVFFIHSSADGHMGWVVSTVPFGYCE